MLRVLQSAFAVAFQARFALGALVTFLVTVAGIPILNIGAPFSALIAGALAVAGAGAQRLARRRRGQGTALAERAPPRGPPSPRAAQPSRIASSESGTQRIRMTGVYTWRSTLFAIRYSLFAQRGGAGRPGSRRWPLTFARGARERPARSLRRPPGAWMGLSTSRAGIGGGLRRIRAHCLDSAPRSSRFHLQPSPGAFPGALALGRSIRQPADAPDHGPGSCIATRPCREPAPRLRACGV